jgi:protein involved in polysaccharide export with SLBB domain
MPAVKKQFRIRILMFMILMLAIPLAVMAPDVYEAQRRASRCYVLGDVVRPGALETFGRSLSARTAIGECNGLLTRTDRNNIQLVRPASDSAPELCLPVNLDDPLTDYDLRPGDRLIVYRQRRH